VANFPLGDALEVYVRREDAERFIEEIRGDEPELAESLRIEERELFSFDTEHPRLIRVVSLMGTIRATVV
jgi:hypothetical protein